MYTKHGVATIIAVLIATGLGACTGGGSTGKSAQTVNAGLDALSANKGASLSLDPTLDSPASSVAQPETNAQIAIRAKEQADDLQRMMNKDAAVKARGPTPRRVAGATPPDDPTGNPAAFALGDVQARQPSRTDSLILSKPPAPTSSVPAVTSALGPGSDRPGTGDAAPSAAHDSAWASSAPASPADKPANSGSQAQSPGTRNQPTTQSGSDDQLVELAAKMARLLREPSAPTNGGARIPDAAALAPIESLRPGALAQLESSKSLLGRRLSSEDRKTLIDARERIAASPGEAADAMAKSIAKLTPAKQLTISRALLCSKVMGFGKYNPFSGTTFIAGRPIPAIVYVEIENFSQRHAREGDPLMRDAAIETQSSVELTQSLSLFQDPSSLLAWHRPPQNVIETSRNQRRDFYLIQQIELPRTLSIGKYNLKITVKDKTTGSEAESIIPISIVAQ